MRASNRKQAMVPAGATVLEPVGTAPGLVVPPAERPRRARRSSCCPGPPRELQPMWARGGRDRRVPPPRSPGAPSTARRCCGCSASPSPRSPRRCGVAERARIDLDGAGDHDLPAPRRGRGRHALRARRAGDLRRASPRSCASATPTRCSPTTARSVDEQVADAAARARLDDRRRPSRARAGCSAARLTDLPGSSDYVAGGLVVYSERGQGRRSRASTRR